MPAYRFPILVWEDYEGWFTASLLDDEQFTSGTAQTAAEAVLQLKEFLTWAYKEMPWRDEPDFHEPQPNIFRVTVRPEYKVEKRVFPCETSIALRVPCVTGKQLGGLLVCALPTLALKFYYYESDALKDLVRHYVQEKLKGLTPQQVARFLPPKAVTLDDITLNINRVYRPWQYKTELKYLPAVAEPLGDKSLRRQFSRAWGREAAVADLVKRSQHEKANVLLVGEPGVGKTTVLIEAVRTIERTLTESPEEKDEDAASPRLYWLTSAARLIAGMKYLGQWEERIEDLIRELSNLNGVLCVDSLLDLVRTGGRTPGDSIAAFLLPYLQRGEVRLMAEATPAELDACRRLLPGFADVFQILKLEPFDRQQAMHALQRVAANFKQNLKLEFDDGTLELIYNLFRRFVPYQVFPGPTIPFLRNLCERAAMAKESQLTRQRVIEQFVRQTGLPELFLRDELPLARDEVIAALQQQVIGQPDAVQTAADVIVTFKAGLNDPHRPLAVLLFAGPTGVGKTELAKAISRFLFGHGEVKDRLVRLDMSEYSGWNAAERLRTAHDGSPSELIKKVREQPFVVLLLDEIEKADAEVFDVLLSVFDEGRLTDRYGRTTTFRSAVIVMTSNLGAEKFSTLGFGEMTQPSYTAEAMSFFRPEFFNRLDAIVRFHPLEQSVIRAITNKELQEIAEREGMLKAGIRLEWSEAVLDLIAREGFDLRFGARPLQRTLETLVVAPLARHLLDHPTLKNVTICLDIDADQRLVFAQKQ
ncbi:MAG TPA: AAA family ATPase [Blastocatellia bacterium]|nr:AAA family ATPase [Blastocatellia bacterium]